MTVIAPAPPSASSRAHLGGEVVAALGVARVRVERRARGREQHDVARLRRARAAARTASCIEPAVTTGATPGERGRDLGARPRRTRRRRARASPRAASTPRSSPLFRPPASSTTESNDATARSVASGFVAFESSYQLTPPASPTSATRWGRVAYDAERGADARGRRADLERGQRRPPARSCDRERARAACRATAASGAPSARERARRRPHARSRSRRLRARSRRRARVRGGRDRRRVGVVGVEHEEVVGGLARA